MQPNLTDLNDAMLELMVQSTKQRDRIKALEAEKERLRKAIERDDMLFIKKKEFDDAFNHIAALEAEFAALKAENENLKQQLAFNTDLAYESMMNLASAQMDGDFEFLYMKETMVKLRAEVATLQGWLFSVAWSNCDCTTLSNSAEYDPRKHEETCEYRTITMNVHMPDPAPYPEE